MKALSIYCPNAYLICLGIKDVENRKWTTKYRGRIYVHSSGEPDFPHWKNMPQIYSDAIAMGVEQRDNDPKWNSMLREEKLSFFEKNFGRDVADYIKFIHEAAEYEDRTGWNFYKSKAIIGEVDIVDVTKNSSSGFAASGYYHFILKNPVLYKEPIKNIKGKLGLWDFKNERN